MPLTDCRDVPFSTSRHPSLGLYEAALQRLHGYSGDVLATIDSALADDPDFVAGHCLRAGALIISNDPAVGFGLRRSVKAAEALADRANERERGHIAASRAWLDGDCERSVKLYGDVLLRYPRDSLALQVAHLGDLYLGHTAMLRDRIARVLPDWDDGVPGYGYVLGMHAFGLEETADYARAEAIGRHAVALQPGDAWAVHAVAHVMEMQGQPEAGIAWLTRTSRDWADQRLVTCHNWWHLCLFHLERCETDRVLQIYDQHIRPVPSEVVRELVDASSLLWRLHLCGADIGGRAAALASSWEPFLDDGYYVFNDVHAMMALLLAGREREAKGLLGALERRGGSAGSHGTATRDVGLPTCHALYAFSRGQWRAALDGLLAVIPLAHRLGGGHAQRDVLSLTTVEAALRAGEASAARALAAERCDLKPFSLANHRLQVRALRCEAAMAPHAPARGDEQLRDARGPGLSAGPPAVAPHVAESPGGHRRIAAPQRSRKASARSLSTGSSR